MSPHFDAHAQRGSTVAKVRFDQPVSPIVVQLRSRARWGQPEVLYWSPTHRASPARASPSRSPLVTDSSSRPGCHGAGEIAIVLGGALGHLEEGAEVRRRRRFCGGFNVVQHVAVLRWRDLRWCASFLAAIAQKARDGACLVPRGPPPNVHATAAVTYLLTYPATQQDTF